MKQTARSTITIRLKPYLQDFFFNESCAVYVSSFRFVGHVIRSFIEPLPEGQAPYFPKGPEFIRFKLPVYHDIELRGNYFISEENQKIIGRCLELHFKELFYNYMDDKVRFFCSFKKSILQFCSDYNIPFNNDFYETLKKDYYRRRKRAVENENNFRRNVPELSLKKIGVFLI